jgi:hypothetical protein
MRSPQYSDLADEQEMLLFAAGGLNASDSGFGGSSNVLVPDDASILQVRNLLCTCTMAILISLIDFLLCVFLFHPVV